MDAVAYLGYGRRHFDEGAKIAWQELNSIYSFLNLFAPHTFIIEMARLALLQPGPPGANKKLPGPSMLNHNLFSGPTYGL